MAAQVRLLVWVMLFNDCSAIVQVSVTYNFHAREYNICIISGYMVEDYVAVELCGFQLS